MKKILFGLVALVMCLSAFSQEVRWWAPDHAEGICVRDSERYRLASGAKSFPHMPETGVSGVGLYAVDRNGQ